jgi:predicted amidohydrolase
METLLVSYLQLDLVWENSDANLAQIEIELAKLDPETDLLVLPEMFNSGFSMNSSKLAQSMDGLVVEAIISWAKQYNFAVVGSFICEEQGQYFNRLLFVHPDGKIEKYDKRHLFRMANETESFSPGTDRLIVTLKGWRIMPLVCYDLRFPVWSRNQFKVEDDKVISEYDLMIYVANWPAARVAAWNKLLLARAIENQAYVVGVNRTGFDGNNIEYNGNSAVIDAKGECLKEPFESVGIQTVLLRKSSLEEFRAKFPVGMDADSFTISR